MLADKAKVFTTSLGIYNQDEGVSQPTLMYVDQNGLIRTCKSLETSAVLDIDDILSKVQDLTLTQVVSAWIQELVEK